MGMPSKSLYRLLTFESWNHVFEFRSGYGRMMICEGLIPPTENHIRYLYDYLEAPRKLEIRVTLASKCHLVQEFTDKF